MPSKNTVKTYIENGYYHIYNRGVDKREIFLDEDDCRLFLYYLKIYLSTPEVLRKEFSTARILHKIENLNLSKEVNLLSFALMPNHFHLQVKQHTSNGIEKLTRRVITGFAQYFNRKYKRLGTLFESAYKAVAINTDIQNVYLSSYIHRNPMKLKNPKFNYLQFSSYFYYLGRKHADWVKPHEILSFFRSSKDIHERDVLSYQNFVETLRENPEEVLGKLTLEDF